MIREVDLVSYLPSFMKSYKESVAALEAENPEFSIAWNAVDRILYNHFISTADAYGIGRYEKMLGIIPLSEDSIEVRRQRCQSKWVSRIPCTIRVLLEKLSALCGDDGFSVSYDFVTGYTLNIGTGFEDHGPVETLDYILDSLIPENIFLSACNTINRISDGRFYSGGSICFIEEFTIASDPMEANVIRGNAAIMTGVGSIDLIETTT